MKPISEHAEYPSQKRSERFSYYISQRVTLTLESIFIGIKVLKSFLKAKYQRNKEHSHSFSCTVVTKRQLHPFLTIILESFLVANNS